MTGSIRAAGAGLLFALPFATLNLIVAKRVDPFFSWIRPGLHTSPLEYGLLAMTLLLLPAGAMQALGPSLRRGPGGKRTLRVANLAAAALLLTAFLAISGALGSEIYACEVLQAPNCD